MSTHVIHALQSGNFQPAQGTPDLHLPRTEAEARQGAEALAVLYPGNRFAVAEVGPVFVAQITATEIRRS